MNDKTTPVAFPNRCHVEEAIKTTENPTGMQLNDGKERVTLPGGTLRLMLRLIDSAQANHSDAGNVQRSATVGPCEDGELKRLAEAATPGPWTVEYAGEFISGHIVSPKHDYAGNTVSRRDSITDPNSMTADDAHFIAAANPATVLMILAENARLRKAVQEAIELRMAPPKYVTGFAIEDGRYTAYGIELGDLRDGTYHVVTAPVTAPQAASEGVAGEPAGTVTNYGTSRLTQGEQDAELWESAPTDAQWFYPGSYQFLKIADNVLFAWNGASKKWVRSAMTIHVASEGSSIPRPSTGETA